MNTKHIDALGEVDQLKRELAYEREWNRRLATQLKATKEQLSAAELVSVMPLRTGEAFHVAVCTNPYEAQFMKPDGTAVLRRPHNTIEIRAIPQFNVFINERIFINERMFMEGPRRGIAKEAFARIADAFRNEIFDELVRQATTHRLLQKDETL